MSRLLRVQLATSQTVNGNKVSNINITIMKPLEPAPDLHFYHMMQMFKFSLFLFCFFFKQNAVDSFAPDMPFLSGISIYTKELLLARLVLFKNQKIDHIWNNWGHGGIKELMLG